MNNTIEGMIKVKCKYYNNYDECVSKRINNNRHICINETMGNFGNECNINFYIDWIKFIKLRDRYIEVKDE